MRSEPTNTVFSWTSRMIYVPGDGNCFFHAIARELNRRGLESSITHTEVRARGVRYLRLHPNILNEFAPENESAEQYLNRMSKVDTWAEGVIIDAVTAEFNISLQIMENRANKDWGFMNINNVPNVRANIGLIHLNNNHYNILNIEEPLNAVATNESAQQNQPIINHKTKPQQILDSKNTEIRSSSPELKAPTISTLIIKKNKPIIKKQPPLVLSKKYIEPRLNKTTDNINVVFNSLILKKAIQLGFGVLSIGLTVSLIIKNDMNEFANTNLKELTTSHIFLIKIISGVLLTITGMILVMDKLKSIGIDNKQNLQHGFVEISHTNNAFCPNDQRTKLISHKFNQESKKLIKIAIEKILQDELNNGSKNIMNACKSMSLRDIDAMLGAYFKYLRKASLKSPKVATQAQFDELIDFIHNFKNHEHHKNSFFIKSSIPCKINPGPFDAFLVNSQLFTNKNH